MGTPTNDSPAFRSRLWMADGGVYDNLGLETAWKACQTILVSDGGGVLRAEVKPKRNWAEHAIRVSSIVDGQVRALRKRQLIGGFARQVRSGTYWGVHSDVDRYAPTTSIPFPAASRERAQRVTTRLAALDAETQRALIQWGYVIADTSLRRWMYPHVEMPDRLPDV